LVARKNIEQEGSIADALGRWQVAGGPEDGRVSLNGDEQFGWSYALEEYFLIIRIFFFAMKQKVFKFG
jgi:hypothetical protein